MKANELMIGDWVYNNHNQQPEQVCEIREHMVMLAYNDLYDYDEIEPIPLTPEALEKNGFIKDVYKDNRLTDMYHLLVPTGFEGKSFTIQVRLYREPVCGVSTLVKCWGWLPPYDGGVNDIHLCSANYVHEIQHALRLCGIDKEIEL